jgi:hypothetical protein
MRNPFPTIRTPLAPFCNAGGARSFFDGHCCNRSGPPVRLGAAEERLAGDGAAPRIEAAAANTFAGDIETLAEVGAPVWQALCCAAGIGFTCSKEGPMEERRKSQRNRTYLSGGIAYNNYCTTLNCLVRNLSPEGARIIFSDAVALPTEFDIVIRRSRDNRRAQMIWRDETQAGIQFLQPADESLVSIENARQIKRVEADRDELARRAAAVGEAD